MEGEIDKPERRATTEKHVKRLEDWDKKICTRFNKDNVSFCILNNCTQLYGLGSDCGESSSVEKALVHSKLNMNQQANLS